MSTAGPTGRAMPRWSVAGAPAFEPALRAGLPGSKACVGVGPPLSARGPSSGSRPVTLCVVVPVIVTPLVSRMRLKSFETTVPARSELVAAVLLATMLLDRLNVEPGTALIPPPLAAALPAMVQLTVVKVAAKLELMAPPLPTLAVLAVKVQLVRLTLPVPMDSAPPPPREPPAFDVLWSNVLPLTVRVMPGESMAPPLPSAWLSVKVQSVRTCVAPPTYEMAQPFALTAVLLLTTQRVRDRLAPATLMAAPFEPTV